MPHANLDCQENHSGDIRNPTVQETRAQSKKKRPVRYFTGTGPHLL